jgi:hypothetical protein
MQETAWITTIEFAFVTGMQRQVANRLCQAIIAGTKRLWHGHALEVRTFHGRGGRSGIQYQVKVSSLPEHLKDRLKALQMTNEVVSSLRLADDMAQFERAWKFEVIEPAIKQPKGSAERKAEIDRLDGGSRLDWTGHKRTLTKSTIYKWIETYELYGVVGLAQRVRRDKGDKKVFVSRAWMQAVPFDGETMATIHSDLKQYVRSLIKGGSQFKQTRVLAGEKLKEMTAAYGFETDNPLVFSIPQEFVQDEHHFKAVYRHKFDRKASEDDRPRIRRSTAGLVPMEIVVMDVHHINVHVRRDDGTYSTPKLIAFHDIATNRVFCELIQFDNRGGVRNSDIITAFVNMCQHPAFGVPQFLYVDNGSEYRFADDLDDALRLGTKLMGFDGNKDRNHVIRAKAYNAAAKHVEGWFRQMNQQHFRHIQGWRDDDPMNPKRPELGKLHAPFEGGFDTFCETVYSHLTAYEHMPQKGALKGRSPAMVFKSFVEKGWKATILDPDRLLMVFTKPIMRQVRQHGIDLHGERWTCDGLLEFFGRSVIAHVPKYHGFAELRITDEDGNDIGIAVSDKQFDVLDERGAKESARRTSLRAKALTKLAKSVPSIDVGAELIEFGRKQLPVVPNEPDATISVNQPGSQRRAILPVAVDSLDAQRRDDEIRRSNDEAVSLLSQFFGSGRQVQ